MTITGSDLFGALVGDPLHNPIDAIALVPPLKALRAVSAVSTAVRAANDGRKAAQTTSRATRLARSAGAAKTEATAGRDALGRFTGAGGYGAAAEARGLSEYELATGQTVIRSQVRASLSKEGNGRFYDGLVQNADGTYTGIEVKSGSASLSASQRAFDEAVSGGQTARAMLNGRPVHITATDLVRVR